MFCAISGEVPQNAVVSKKNGYLYERRLIEKYIEVEGKCPVSGVELVESDLIPVQANKAVKPKPISASSVPGMLTMLQNEWDEHMIEMYTLKSHLDTTRQELSHSLYQHDAACRVIARLMRERDEARAMLSALQSQGISLSLSSSSGTELNEREIENRNERERERNGESPMEQENNEREREKEKETALDKTVIEAINEKCAELSAGRKGRKVPEGLLSRERVSSFNIAASNTPHKTDKPGITCVAIQPGTDPVHTCVVFTGGMDKEGILTNKQTGQVLGNKLVGHNKKLTSVNFHPNWPVENYLYTASADMSVKIWTGKQSDAYPDEGAYHYQESLTICPYKSEISALSLHPTGHYAVTTSLDGTWSMLDMIRGSTLCTVTLPMSEECTPYLCGSLHPDGVILATGTEAGVMKVWDTREQRNVANCTEHTGGVSCLSFSENGYYLSSGSHDGTVKIWDLRKIKCIKTFPVDDASDPVNAVSFDHSGSYLAIGSSSLSIINTKSSKEW
eukprot:CAMPEP_0182424146 /NCGR_PEP_ID=MMETSP1167-20130531/10268_1 /TAXON_ID=2988 /ORGANISM="Mallomonas Sp, Strain CCMP3275" /LENGTH=506 /DNA_ID=CAMNT_0024603717 /DNA_START=143 /DNA_END=1660 /DNA_ORIENTATION=-